MGHVGKVCLKFNLVWVKFPEALLRKENVFSEYLVSSAAR